MNEEEFNKWETGYEKLYYVSVLIQKCVVMVFVSIMCIKSKSVFKFMIKDFKIGLFDSISDKEGIFLNYI